MTQHRIFISYSRKDSAIITPLVDLLRLGGSGVFRDVDHILPGLKWRVVLIDAVDCCELLVLFWCCHSSASAEVEKEYKQALAGNKLLAPVLLDNTPLTEELAEYQAIDMRGLFGNHVGYVPENDHEPPKMDLIRPWEPVKPPRFREVVCEPNEAAIHVAGNHLLESLAARLGVVSLPEHKAEPGPPAEVGPLLLKLGAISNGAALVAAAQNGDLPTVELLLSRGVDVNSVVTGRTALFWAAFRSYTDIVKVLLESGANPNVSYMGIKLLSVAGSMEWNPTQSCYEPGREGESEVARLLIEYGATM